MLVFVKPQVVATLITMSNFIRSNLRLRRSLQLWVASLNGLSPD